MAVVKIRNLNKYPFTQKYQGKDVSIGAGEYIEMDEEEASVFVGMFFPFKRDNKGQDDPRYFKMLRIERDSAAVSVDKFANKFMCTACKEQTSSWVELEAHMRLMHSDQPTASDPELDKELAQKRERGAKATAGGTPGA